MSDRASQGNEKQPEGAMHLVGLETQDQVPVIGQEAEAKQLDAGLVLAVGEELEERGVVAGLAEDAHAAVAAVEHVINDAGGGGTGGARHGRRVTGPGFFSKWWMSCAVKRVLESSG